MVVEMIGASVVVVEETPPVFKSCWRLGIAVPPGTTGKLKSWGLPPGPLFRIKKIGWGVVTTGPGVTGATGGVGGAGGEMGTAGLTGMAG